MRTQQGTSLTPLDLNSQGAPKGTPRSHGDSGAARPVEGAPSTSTVEIPRKYPVSASGEALARQKTATLIRAREISQGAPVESAAPLQQEISSQLRQTAVSSARVSTTPLVGQYRSSLAAQAVERWGRALDAMTRAPLLKGEISQEASLGAMRHHSEFKAASMVVHVASPQGPSVEGVPADLLMRIVAQEVANRALGIPKTVCVIGQKLAEVARPDMSLGEREQTSRISFGLLRLIEKLNAHGFGIEARLDTDVAATSEYKQAQRDLKHLANSTYPVAHQEACLVETLRRQDGSQVYSGWTSFNNLKEFEQLREGVPGANRNFVRYCSIPVRAQLETALPLEYALVAAVPGVALTQHGLMYTHPDVVAPVPQLGHTRQNSRLIRLLLNRNDEANLQATFKDPFELDHVGQRAQIELQRHTWHMLMSINKLAPQLLDHPRALLADLDVAERVVQLWKQEATQATQASAMQASAHLWQSMLAAANIRNEVLKHYLRALFEELGLELGILPTNGATSFAVPQITSAKALMLDDEAFSGSPATERRNAETLDTSFRNNRAA